MKMLMVSVEEALVSPLEQSVNVLVSLQDVEQDVGLIRCKLAKMAEVSLKQMVDELL